MYPYDLTDGQGVLIEAFFPERYHPGKAGHPWKEHRPLVNGILWHLHTGALGRIRRSGMGRGRPCMIGSIAGTRMGRGPKILEALLLRLDKAGLIARDLWLVDAPVIRASRAAAGAKKSRLGSPVLAGPDAWHVSEPPDHALGRSQASL